MTEKKLRPSRKVCLSAILGTTLVQSVSGPVTPHHLQLRSALFQGRARADTRAAPSDPAGRRPTQGCEGFAGVGTWFIMGNIGIGVLADQYIRQMGVHNR